MKKVIVLLLTLTTFVIFGGCDYQFKNAVKNRDMTQMWDMYMEVKDTDKDKQDKYDDIIIDDLNEFNEYLEDLEITDEDLNNIDNEEDAFYLVVDDWKAFCKYPLGTYEVLGRMSEKVGNTCKSIDKMINSKFNYILGNLRESEEDYINANGCYSQVLEDDCMYDTAKQKHKQCIDKYADVLKDEIISDINDEAFDDASGLMTDLYELTNQNDIDTSKVKNAYDEVCDKYVNAFTENKIANFNPSKNEDDSDDEYDEDEDKTSLLDEINSELDDLNINDYEDKVVTILKTNGDKYITKAKEFFDKGDVNAAIGNVDAALMYLPEEDSYLKLKKQYKEYLPFKFYDRDNVFHCKDNGGELNMGAIEFLDDRKVTSNNNKLYGNVIQFGTDEFHVEYKTEYTYLLNGKYDTLTGVAFVSNLYKNDKEGNQVYFRIYGDDKLIYTSSMFDVTTLPENIKVNVKGVQKLKIIYGMNKKVNHGLYELNISNLVAKKDLPKK